jgi:hypothetical protein
MGQAKQQSQATRLTKEQCAMFDHWTCKGHKFRAGEIPPKSTQTPPSLATRCPVIDALIGLFVIVFVMLLLGLWVYYGAGLHG